MSDWKRKLEISTNVAILLVCCFICIFLIRTGIRRPHATIQESTAPTLIVRGQPLNIPRVDWSKSDKTIVIALSTQCHFCKESAPFYRTLAKKAFEQHARLLAVLPQTENESKLYLSEEHVAPADVIQLPLARIGVEGTPTLLLADSSGKILEVWVGKLSPEREAEVLSKL